MDVDEILKKSFVNKREKAKIYSCSCRYVCGITECVK